MTSRNWFFKGMTEEIKRRLWAVALSVLAFFFTFPVSMVYLTTQNDFSDARDLNYFIDSAEELLSYHNGWTVVLMAVMAVVLAFSGFSYLNSRSKVDFYHCLPIRREKQFLIRYLCGILITAVPYLFFSVISVQIAAAAGAPAGELMKTALFGWAYQMVSFLIPYTTAVIAAMLTGNIVVGLMGFGVLNIYFPLFVLLWQGLAEMCLETFCSHDLAADWAGKVSPMFFYIDGFDQTVTGGMILSRLVTAGILVAIAAVLHKKRPSEAAGKAMAFPLSQPLIRIMITVEAAVSGLMFFWTLGGREFGWALFGLFAGGVICHCVIEIIYHFDFKKLFSHKKQMALSLILAFGIFALFFWDLTGYDRWLPKDGSLESAAAYVQNEVDSWVDYGTLVVGREEDNRGFGQWIRERDEDYLAEHMTLKDGEQAVSLARTWVENWNQTGMDAVRGSGLPEERVYVLYRLKNGRTAERVYDIPGEQTKDLFRGIYDDSGYKEGRYPLLGMEEEQLNGIQVSYMDKESLLSEKEGISRETLSKILKIYQKELSSLSLEQSGELPVGEIRFLDDVRLQAAEGTEDQEITWIYGDLEYYPIYPSFTGTLAALEEQKIAVGDPVDPAGVRSVWVEAEVETEENFPLEKSISYMGYEEKDREVIEKIVREMKYGPYREYCSFSDFSGEISLRVRFEDDTDEAFFIPDGSTADWLRERIRENAEE